MSIVPLVHVTLIGAESDRDAVLEELQQVGLLHVVSLVPPSPRDGPDISTETQRALRYLQEAPLKRSVVQRDAIDVEEVQRRSLALMAREADLRDERDYLQAKLRALAPWGDFDLPELGRLGHGPEGPLRLWFYEIPSHRVAQLEGRALAWSAVARRPGVAYVVVVSDREPEDMPVARTEAGAAPLSRVRTRLRAVDEALEDLVFERAELTKYRARFEAHLDELFDVFEREEVARQTGRHGPLFLLAGWMRADRRAALSAVADAHHLAVVLRTPTRAGEGQAPGGDARSADPPTLLENRGLARAGQSLVSFYTTPGYFEWDPSVVVLASFSVFFAMIMSDAGYGLLLMGLLGLSWRAAGRALGSPLRAAFLGTLALSIAWGTAVGSYFGVGPDDGSLLGRLQILEVNDYDAMMRVSVTVGAAHVILANLLRAVFVPSSGRLGALGWCLAVGTGLGWWLTAGDARLAAPVGAAAPWLLGLSGVLVLAFSSTRPGFGARLLDGARSLTGVTSAFGDVLSYLRLFALGLASTSLGLAFNDLGARASRTEGVGLLLAALVLLLGHTINLGLAIMSGFVHGLRLNYIEFLRWGTTTEGRPFRAFGLRRRARAGAD